MKRAYQILMLAGMFVLGAMTHKSCFSEIGRARGLGSSSVQRESSTGDGLPQSSPFPSTMKLEKALSDGKREQALVLPPEVVDALLSGGSLKRQLSRMGLSEGEVAEVERIRVDSMAKLKNLEADNSRPVSDEKGEYIEIDAFPTQRQQWLLSIEEALRTLVQDDRATVISRMISSSDNDEEVGLYRRELFLNQPKSVGGPLQIEERTFNEAGNLIDSDYELLDRNSESRWGHLLEFETEE